MAPVFGADAQQLKPLTPAKPGALWLPSGAPSRMGLSRVSLPTTSRQQFRTMVSSCGPLHPRALVPAVTLPQGWVKGGGQSEPYLLLLDVVVLPDCWDPHEHIFRLLLVPAMVG